MPKRYASMQERIIANSVIAPVETTFNGSSCWWWIGALAGNGRYGKVSVRSSRVVNGKRKVKHKLAHRVSREVFKGEFFRRGKYAMHLCHPHNNRMICVNPDHIGAGTPRQNNRQTVAEGRHRNGHSA